MNPTGGDLQAASGGRRNVPLVASLVSLTDLESCRSFAGRHRKDPLWWAKGMAASENTWAALAEICAEQQSEIRVARIDLEAGTALGFNVNREWVG